jgi:TPR repeat protein
MATAIAVVFQAVPTRGAPPNADSLLIVDCLLPGQVRRLGTQATYVTARRAMKTSAADCAIRGGEYTATDRASYATSMRVWLPLAKAGDADAQTNLGEILEKGIGGAPQPDLAVQWYELAAEQGSSRAQLNWAPCTSVAWACRWTAPRRWSGTARHPAWHR